MKKICAFSFSLLLLAGPLQAVAQDSIPYPLRIKVGIDLFGPSYYLVNNSILTLEGMASMDIDSSLAVALDAGILRYSFSQYNYEYNSSGIFFKTGVDFNLLNPVISKNRYYAGIGLRYGISFYKHEAPTLNYENYWSDTPGSVAMSSHVAHFIEASPGIRADLSKNISIGWAIKLKVLIHSGADKKMRAVQIPGYGNGLKAFNPGISYYLILSFRYRNL